MKTKLFLTATLFAVISAKAQLATINENFDSFTTGTSALPQNGWNKVAQGPLVYVDGANGNNYVQSYALFSPNVAAYLITPQIIAPDGTKKISFTAAQTDGSAGAGSIQVGLVSGTAAGDMSSFTALGDAISLTSSTAATYTFDVPVSTFQYIAFKFIGNVQHAAIYVDNVVYGSSMAVTENAINKNDLKFALTSDKNSLQFVSEKVTPVSATVYSASGQLAVQGKINNNRFDISILRTGIYYIIIEDINGKQIKSKFIK